MRTETPPNPTLDLDAYLERIAYTGPRVPTDEALAELHLAHATHISFENIDVVLGHTPDLDPGALQAKLVRNRRGGYCFEQNMLFAAVLERIGFRVTRLAARVWYRAARRLPRTHMLLRVDVDGAAWVADVGFGGAGLLRPLPLADRQEERQFAWEYRLLRGAGTWTLQSRFAGAWADLYEFSEDPHEPVDYEPANYFVATHPSSPFTRTLTVQRSAPDVRYTLRNRELITDRGDQRAETVIVSDADLLGVLEAVFGLRLPPGTRLPNHPWGESAQGT